MYFICDACDAKWFAETDVMPCPRCATLQGSNIDIEPPWESASTAASNAIKLSNQLTRATSGAKGVEDHV